MKRYGKLVLIVALWTVSFSAFSTIDEDYSAAPTSDVKSRWKLAYYEGGPHGNYYKYLLATVDGLVSLGWLPKHKIPARYSRDTRLIWDWLSENVKSDYVEFVSNAYYSANWDSEVRKQLSSEIVRRLNRKDVLM